MFSKKYNKLLLVAVLIVFSMGLLVAVAAQEEASEEVDRRCRMD